YGCKSYPKCKFVSNYEPTNLKCPECKKSHLVKKELKSGTFFECPACKFKEKQD
ncbi:MAG: topoisomerase DNA-binding C4 zinc finger domain-containing protein, partial [Campylobacter sp.]|nr:topoisomerase DNA-binding C4 zinc finger domain-containing protein [Campylobacter sp.]